MSLSDDEVKKTEKKLIGKFPNTYTFTKNCAEKYILKHKQNLKVVISRPSIIGGSCV